ncbi:translocation and assembly module lipoprotein TamL [Ohtaekwangia sp.]|uniref:translocation and assembly module lipoprotein TamL n=1 Tax=Ohtaekwangia sp. TaxID=2066019 RepID=UPI002FDEF84E
MQSKTDLRGTLRIYSLRCALLTTVWLLASCTATKYLKEDEVFYNGAEINFETPEGRVGRKKALRSELQTYINPKPNGRLLKARPGVWFYYIAGTPKKKKGGLRNFIRTKLGAPPVFMKETTPDRTAKMLESQLHNDGYFRSTVSQQTIIKGKNGKVIYTVQLYRPFRLRNIQYPQPKDSIYKAILGSLKEKSLLDTGQRFNVERMQAEQMRIEEVVENYGFYYFDNRYLVFEADSTVGKRKVDLTLKLEKDIPARARKIYHLDNIRVFPNYSLSTDSIQTSKPDTTEINGYRYIDDKHAFRPEIITDVINLKKGRTYSREEQELTLTHLMGLGAFKFVNVKFLESPRKDSAMLDADIYLTPLKKKSIRMEVQAVSKSNNFVGPGIGFTFTNRNFLRGAELFQLKLNTSYEVQISRQTSGALNAFEAGLESSLTIPRFISPIHINYNSSRYLPKTQFKIGFNLQNRVSFFRINSFNVGYGYNWKENIAKSHELFPIDINFVRTDKKSAVFEALLASNSVLASSFEDQFIIGTRYSYTLNTQLSEAMELKYEKKKYREHNFYFNGTIDVAGNLLNTVQRTIKKGEEPYEIFNSPYSQYVRGDIDFRYYWQLDTRNKIATRIIAGVGYAYGNSTTMPYIKQFAIGGSNSIRAFPARSIGPGAYDVRSDPARNNSLFVDQRGDMKLEGNLEYRFDLVKVMKGALFVDAGNIWLLHNDSTRIGGQFQRNTFMKQLAVGTGAGLRFDFSFFVLRLDVAFPLRRPAEGWVTRDIDFTSSDWRGKNLVFNIAIGYPF